MTEGENKTAFMFKFLFLDSCVNGERPRFGMRSRNVSNNNNNNNNKCFRLSVKNKSFVPTFLCSDAVLGLSGVVFMLAGVAATGEEEVFSIISAGIFFYRKISHKTTANYDPLVQDKRTMNVFKSPLCFSLSLSLSHTHTHTHTQKS